MSDWFSREDSVPEAVIVRKPNPKNVQNIEKIKELEEQIQRYVFDTNILPAFEFIEIGLN
jgi:kinetochore protein Mis13/DSN1